MSDPREVLKETKLEKSRALHERASKVMPAGVGAQSQYRPPHPIYVSRARGSRLYDRDGNEYIDFMIGAGSLIHGHAHPAIIRAVREALEEGVPNLSATERQIELVERLVRYVPSMERVRFLPSGTEGVQSIVRLARAYTGRDKIAKFEGAYHGTHDWVLVSVSTEEGQGGSRKRPKSVAWSAGVPAAVMKHVVVLPWNDLDACVKILEKEAGDLAALIIDPMLANAGMIPVAEGFLEGLRAATAKLGILLIFDEVISFRVATGGAQARFGIRPDLTTLGKIIGGGLAVGAFGGRAEVMNYYDPRGGKGRINHGGTFNANPLTMAGGVATMEQLTPEAYARLDILGDRLRTGVAKALRSLKYPGQITGTGSLFWLHHTKKRLTDYRSQRPADPTASVETFMALINEGFLISQRGLGACSLAMTDADVDRFVEAVKRVLGARV
jgi:glutamate-1-semialdehyde 2,1-aminomutase